ncbi:MAG: cadherin-like domain-containing protein [gamma proteobacterium endosymbiont of Lamellibrachia anaximandri]|nr:cadherin-like domain-containing protein [gamma proteobacterium endosymbiont of Lamellibrachia anaximandri]MBL3616577.1 cadherin-like domain-containing protein [gamma proteobacterium endosymbiont of Lamellibrachia anaximandri]
MFAQIGKLVFVVVTAFSLAACGSGSGDTSSVSDTTGSTVLKTTANRISSSMDDVEEEVSGSIYSNSSDLELINDDQDQVIGMRFVMDVPQGAVIDKASVRFTVDEVSTGAGDLEIFAEHAIDAESFASSNYNVSSRITFSETVSWKPGSWNVVGESGHEQETPDLAALIQKVVDQPQWQPGHHLVLVIRGSGRRTASSYDGDAASAPLLNVDYFDGGNTGGTGTDPVQPNRPPELSGTPALTVAEGEGYVFTPVAVDADNDALVFSISNLPSWANFSAVNGGLSGTPDFNQSGTYTNISISVTDGAETVSLAPFSITVTDVNRAPVISGLAPTQVVAGGSYQFTPSAVDQDGDALIFSITGKPAWATFDSSTGRLFGTPSVADAGNYENVGIAVSDGVYNVALPGFSISVSLANSAPTISGTPLNEVTEGALYQFTPVAGDADNNPLVFSIINMPSWAVFNSANGRLSGTPSGDYIGEYNDIRISVSDGVASAALAAFSINVLGINHQPVANDDLVSATAGQVVPIAVLNNDSGLEDGPITLSVLQNTTKGSLSINGDNTFSYLPDAGYSGLDSFTYQVVDIDGESATATVTLSVTCEGECTTHMARISWSQSSGVGVQEYRVHFGTQSGVYTQWVVADTMTSHDVTVPGGGAWYFSVTAVDSLGVESGFADEVSLTF